MRGERRGGRLAGGGRRFMDVVEEDVRLVGVRGLEGWVEAGDWLRAAPEGIRPIACVG